MGPLGPATCAAVAERRASRGARRTPGPVTASNRHVTDVSGFATDESMCRRSGHGKEEVSYSFPTTGNILASPV
ncbi:hypothetical protein GCM10010345_94650 [Streptomyces canarius]|uniref:Uncharacterized protein n=1 Tax=Streptomyces canarius TaxID=285453 RepID=A0ABQ3DC33_9ACTN|nr:hypothetical protein GCM10010345_94650 [Streptomyces canarius]